LNACKTLFGIAELMASDPGKGYLFSLPSFLLLVKGIEKAGSERPLGWRMRNVEGNGAIGEKSGKQKTGWECRRYGGFWQLRAGRYVGIVRRRGAS
jgi:hypothetical protein